MNKRYVIPKIIYSTTNPTNTDDDSVGYVIGQPWVNTNSREYFICVNTDINNAIWQKINLEIYENEFRVGKSNFLGNNHCRYIYHGLDISPTFVSIFPIEQIDNQNPVGDIWVQLNNDDYFEVYNTGGSTVRFCWFACSELFDYNELTIELEENLGYIYTNPYSGIIDKTSTILYPINTVVELYVYPYSDNVFQEWIGYDSLIAPNIAQINLTENKTIQAIFDIVKYTLSVTKINGSYGGILSTPYAIQCGSVCSSQFNKNTDIVLTPVINNTDALFEGWEGCDSVNSNNECLVQLNTDRNVTAIFRLNKPRLIINKYGNGDVQSTIDSIDCGLTCVYFFNYGHTVSLTAIPHEGNQFIEWFGDISSQQITETVVMDSDKVIGVSFLATNVVLKITKDGIGNVISSDGTSINCGSECQNVFDHGTELTLTAQNSVSHVFSKWEIDGVDNFNNPLTLTLDSDINLKAVFEFKTYNITSTTDGNGTIDTIENPYNYNENIILSANPNIGYELNQWIGCDDVINNQCYIYNIDEDKHIDLLFNTITPASGTGQNFAYVCGGKETNQISKFIFPFESGNATHNNDLDIIKYSCSANHSSNYAYICAGQNNQLCLRDIERFAFSNDTGNVVNNCSLSTPKQHSCANNSTHYGYVCSGNWNLTDIDKFQFPFDAGQTSNVSNLSEIYYGSGFNSSTHGYVTGSLQIIGSRLYPHHFTDKFDFSLDNPTASKTVDISKSYNNPSACNSSFYGYITSGIEYNIQYLNITGFDRIDLSIDSGVSENFTNLTNIKNNMCANNSTLYGYVCGGSDVQYNSFSYINKINFSLPSTNMDSVEIYLNESKYFSAATDGTMFW